MNATCTALGRGPPAANDAEALKRISDWETQSLDCIRTGAAASNASHAAGIVANEESEIPARAAGLRSGLQSLGNSAGRYRDLQNMLNGDCTRKAREARIEFHYNVVFSNPPGAPAWGLGAADWDSVEGALSALPAQATWANPQMITFTRAACHPSNLNAQGQCVGSGGAGGVSTFIGGEAHPNTGGIDVFDAGLSSSPFSRSAQLKLSGTQQTIRHEVGHLIDAQVPPAEMAHFFKDIVGWEDFSWSWITTPTSPHANWRAERERLRLQLGFTEAQLTAWLDSLQPGQPVTVGQLTYTRGPSFLTANDPLRIPAGVEFEYGRTNRGEYFAELYALAVSRPAFLYDAIPSAQSEWLKRVVFGTPATGAEWAAQLAVRGGVTPGVIQQLLRVYTWEQAQTILDAFLATQTTAGGTPT